MLRTLMSESQVTSQKVDTYFKPTDGVADANTAASAILLSLLHAYPSHSGLRCVAAAFL